jgi:uncharacterized membrane-anchored protein
MENAMSKRSTVLIALLCCCVGLSSAWSKKPTKKPAATAVQTEAEPPAEKSNTESPPAAPQENMWWSDTAIVGPAQVDLEGQAKLDLPDGFVYLAKQEAQALMERLGNKPGPTDVGVILPKKLDDNAFIVTVDWAREGYVKDNDADKLDADKILDSIKEGTEDANEYRKEHGFPPVEVVGWGEKPRYERPVHHVVWAVIGKSEKGESANFNTRLLGRYGVLSLNLICSPEQLTNLKPTMADLLKRTTFGAGNRYEDFQAGQDRVADYGLVAMVIGGSALAGKVVKVGLLAKFGKVLLGILLAMKKAFVLLLVGIAAFLRRLFGGKASAEPAPVDTSPPDNSNDNAPTNSNDSAPTNSNDSAPTNSNDNPPSAAG